MTVDIWTNRLSEYIDGELTARETEALEAHLEQCAECAGTVEQLRAVVARAQQVMDRPPENDLWTGIAARIASAEGMSGSGRPAVIIHNRGRRLSFSIPQLAAASIVLMLISAGSMYLVLNLGPGTAPLAQAPQQQVERVMQPDGQVAAGPEMEPATTSQTAAAPAASTATPVSRTADDVTMRPAVTTVSRSGYDEAVRELEAVLERERAQLDPETVRVLEENLAIIDHAIADARSALARDPASVYLNRYLDQSLQRKIQLLRRATGILRVQA